MGEVESIRIQGRNTMSDYIHAVHTFVGHEKGIWLARLIMVPGFLFGWHLLSIGKAIQCGVLFVAVGPLIWFNTIQVLMMWLGVRKTPKMRDTYEAIFDDTGMRIKAPSASSDVEWSFYNRLIETRRVFLLCFDKATYHVIPKRAFNSPEDIDAFRDLAKSHIG